jgi:hypothetical protein
MNLLVIQPWADDLYHHLMDQYSHLFAHRQALERRPDDKSRMPRRAFSNAAVLGGPKSSRVRVREHL